MTPTVVANADPVIQSGNIMIDEAGYSAKLNGVQLDLTYTEFELLSTSHNTPAAFSAASNC